MSNVSKSVLAAENRSEGRVIPGWAFTLVAWLPIIAVIVSNLLPEGFWWNFGLGFVTYLIVAFTLISYKKKAIL